MRREILSSADAPAAIGPYSQGVVAEGKFAYFSGQIPLTAAGELVSGSVGDQAGQVMKNIEALLTAAGLSRSNVVKSTIFLSSMDHFGEVNDVYGEFYGADPPAESTVAVLGLPKGVDVEIETIAVF